MQSGDREAMHTVYRTYVRYLTATAARYLPDDEDVKDVLQNAFMKIFSSISSFTYSGVGSLRAWMTRIVVNEALKWLARGHRLELVEIDDIAHDSADDDDVDTDEISVQELHRLIRDLPDGYRAVFNLYVIEGRSHKEIAQLLGIKPDSSASQFHRAKAMLADRIKKYNLKKSHS